MLKLAFVFTFTILLITCKPSATQSNLSSFRSDKEGNATVSIGIFMNDYPTVVDGEFFPFELYKGDFANLSGDAFKGFSADVITNKDPLEGFKNQEGIEKSA